MNLVSNSTPQADHTRSEMVFSGTVVVYRQVEAMNRLVSYLRNQIQTGFDPYDPLTAEQRMDAAVYRQTSMGLRKAVANDPRTEDLFRSVFEAVGCDLDTLYWDHLKLRFQPSDTTLHSRYMRNLPAHRDTWGSNIMAQINWWAPVWPVSEGCTLTVFPEYWDKPIENNTAGWSYQEFRHRRAEDPNTTYPMLPTCTVEPDVAQGLPIVVDPGDIIAFSGAHLHASVPNKTGTTRISTETRTVSLGDLRSGRHARNIDGAAEGIRYNWFTQVSSGEALSEASAAAS